MAIKVSVCIPTYNQVDLLKKTLESVQSQRFADYELIVSDDSPGDEIKELLDGFNFGNRLKYYKNAPSLGTPANWNAAISHACGEYIKLLHHDDFFTSENSLEEYVSLLDKNPQADFAFSATSIWRLSDNVKWDYQLSEKKSERLRREPEFLFFGNWIGAPSAVIYRRTVADQYDTNLKWLVDTDLYIRILQKNPVFVYHPGTLVCTTDGAAGQVTRTVINDRNTQVSEHIYLYNKIRSGRNEEKFSLFFQVLLKKYDVRSMTDLAGITDIPNELRAFFTQVIYRKDKNVFIRRFANWFYSSRFNNHIFKLERY